MNDFNETPMKMYSEIEHFISHVESLQETLPLLMSVLDSIQTKSSEEFKSFLENHAIDINKDEDDHIYYSLNVEHAIQSNELTKRLRNTNIAYSFLPDSFVVSLISQFDVFLGGVIRVMFYLCPELLNSSDKKIDLSRLVTFESIDEAKEFVIEKEIEAVLRDSHFDQICWLEKKLNTTLREGLDIWPDFIELTERRNLFVHSDGIVSRQYLKICNQHNFQFKDPIKLGDRLKVSPNYYDKACDIILEIGIKLAHVIWRKFDPVDREGADRNLNDVACAFIQNGNYFLATELLDFATETIKKHSSEEIYLYMLINKAQALKWNKQEEESKSILKAIDWGAKDNIYKLARFILTDEYEQASEIMKIIGNKHEIVNKIAYKGWPLFKEFRNSKIFLNTYEHLFNEKFLLDEESN